MKYELGWILTRDPIANHTLVSKHCRIWMHSKLKKMTLDWTRFVSVWDSGYWDRLPTVRGRAHGLLQLRSKGELYWSTTWACGVVEMISSWEKDKKCCILQSYSEVYLAISSCYNQYLDSANAENTSSNIMVSHVYYDPLIPVIHFEEELVVFFCWSILWKLLSCHIFSKLNLKKQMKGTKSVDLCMWQISNILLTWLKVGPLFYLKRQDELPWAVVGDLLGGVAFLPFLEFKISSSSVYWSFHPERCDGEVPGAGILVEYPVDLLFSHGRHTSVIISCAAVWCHKTRYNLAMPGVLVSAGKYYIEIWDTFTGETYSLYISLWLISTRSFEHSRAKYHNFNYLTFHPMTLFPTRSGLPSTPRNRYPWSFPSWAFLLFSPLACVLFWLSYHLLLLF